MALRDPLAPYACDATRSRGRLHPVSPSPTRSEFQRDRDRIIHSTAFRRLAHKTQVFVPLDGDHFRTRLTHTIEVGQIARALARALRVDEDLAEAVALAHDLGHTPFGHAGEDALEACMKPFGGFDHNAQALRVVTLLERRYADYDGLDLCWETLEGIVKHNGPLAGPKATRKLPRFVAEFDAAYPLELATFASVEAQAAAQADDIAYIGHDIDDGLRAGLFLLEDIAAAVPFIASLLQQIGEKHPGLERGRVIHELVRRVITRFVEDAIATALGRLERLAPASAADVRAAGEAMVALSPAMAEAERDIKKFLFANMYRHQKVKAVWERARDAISRLFPAFFETPSLMPPEWAAQALAREGAARAVVVADYIAGMTDRYALGEAKRLFGA
ncbi:deoxyguanosinetriphosphate triphosphohydrolase [Methylocystis sp. ATCC 49242]|uniref:deoxyguanosinetriphosphate triphosphohydrolase n=1 Tax=Methylocystis sp. ATCC 49242 TaxID=622637 RepID=UPI0001F875CC|nr:deoxyguanosinetriphosphate triphosphohydrolase [Methylocystis sp. ATCC 49242]